MDSYTQKFQDIKDQEFLKQKLNVNNNFYN